MGLSCDSIGARDDLRDEAGRQQVHAEQQQQHSKVQERPIANSLVLKVYHLREVDADQHPERAHAETEHPRSAAAAWSS